METAATGQACSDSSRDGPPLSGDDGALNPKPLPLQQPQQHPAAEAEHQSEAKRRGRGRAELARRRDAVGAGEAARAGGFLRSSLAREAPILHLENSSQIRH